jgi:hypothetical protein
MDIPADVLTLQSGLSIWILEHIDPLRTGFSPGFRRLVFSSDNPWGGELLRSNQYLQAFHCSIALSSRRGRGEVEEAATLPSLVPSAPEKHRQEVVIVGSMRVRMRGRLKIGFDTRVELQIPPSHNDDLTTPRGSDDVSGKYTIIQHEVIQTI